MEVVNVSVTVSHKRNSTKRLITDSYMIIQDGSILITRAFSGMETKNSQLSTPFFVIQYLLS